MPFFLDNWQQLSRRTNLSDFYLQALIWSAPQCNVTVTILWQGMQLNWLYFYGICQMMPLKVMPKTASVVLAWKVGAMYLLAKKCFNHMPLHSHHSHRLGLGEWWIDVRTRAETVNVICCLLEQYRISWISWICCMLAMACSIATE